MVLDELDACRAPVAGKPGRQAEPPDVSRGADCLDRGAELAALDAVDRRAVLRDPLREQAGELGPRERAAPPRRALPSK